MFELSENKQEILKADGHMLIMGGPGSGKTTVALFKARQIVESKLLKKEQKILFLSFARATISRVEEQAHSIITKQDLDLIEISTYHAFSWDVLKSHGYLINQHNLKLLPPHEAASKLNGISNEELPLKLDELFQVEGIVHFDLFAKKCSELLQRSNALRKLVCDVYPYIILDEFQDTNTDEWNLISILGQYSTLIV